MGIFYHEKENLFQILTPNTEYCIGIADGSYVGHVYYGKRMEDIRCSYLLRTGEAPFVPSVNEGEKGSFTDNFPYEYSTWGVGDYRESCLIVRNSDGYRGCELMYDSYRIFDGKPELPGLPATFCKDECVRHVQQEVLECPEEGIKREAQRGQETEKQRERQAQAAEVPTGVGRTAEVPVGAGQTLEIVCRDAVIGLKVILRYSVFDDSDAIMRSVELQNESEKPLYVEKVLSASMDMDAQDYELLTLNGSWARERHMERSPLSYGKHGVSSVRGISSHQEQPFLAVLGRHADQDQGEVYAMHFVYSGNFLAQVQKSQFDSLRMVMGIHPEGFEWVLEPGASFTAPEVICVYSSEGLGQMTHTFHELYRNHLIRSPYLHRERPVLINNWEATYFDFDTDKLLSIAREAKKRGIEMLVMDDGWFGHRDRPEGSLGDWVVNEQKLRGGLQFLGEELDKMGMRFGIWFEPEMISPNSNLYRSHPDWAIQIPERKPTLSRAQYVLDLSRQDVLDAVYEAVASVIRSANISYVKWDMNRQLTDVGSLLLDAAHQGELYHRYILGVYAFQERLTEEFPELLLENCSSGGARFDPGMLFYSPQIWCSDNTDAVERLAIQEGTALLYPLSTIGAHVSDCPNHLVGRRTPFETRGHVALAGTFGYELDITKIAEEEREQIPEQIQQYHTYQPLIREGDYYRIASWTENHTYDCWQVVSKEKEEALVTFVQVRARANVHSRRIRLKGLNPAAEYRLVRDEKETGEVYSGRLLMQGGILIPEASGDAVSHLYHFLENKSFTK